MSYALLRPLLFSMDPEQAHEKTLEMLEAANKAHLLGFIYAKQALPTECMGVSLPNPVGLAAGLDKNGAYIDALAELGFGFLEIGTVTPRPQAGNDKPRLFRIKEAHGIINRMGFNNDGVDQMIDNISAPNIKAYWVSISAKMPSRLSKMRWMTISIVLSAFILMPATSPSTSQAPIPKICATYKALMHWQCCSMASKTAKSVWQMTMAFMCHWP